MKRDIEVESKWSRTQIKKELRSANSLPQTLHPARVGLIADLLRPLPSENDLSLAGLVPSIFVAGDYFYTLGAPWRTMGAAGSTSGVWISTFIDFVRIS